MRKNLLAAIIASIGGGAPNQTWSMPSWSTPSAITWTGGSGPSGMPADSTELLTAIQTMGAGSGGTVYIDPSVTYGALTLTSTGSATVYVVTQGTESQRNLPAENFASSTRANITQVTLSNTSYNVQWHCVRFGSSTTVIGGGLVSAGTGGDFVHYGCEFQGIELGAYDYPLVVDVTNTATFTVGQSVTGSVSGSTATIKNIMSATRMLVVVTMVGPNAGSQVIGGTTTNIPFLAGSDTIAGVSVTALAAYFNVAAYAARDTFRNFLGQDFWVHHVGSGFKFNVSGSYKTYGGRIDMSYSDMTSIGANGDIPVEVSFLVGTRPFGLATDFANPHIDGFQFLGNNQTVDKTNLITRGCLFINGFSRGVMQSIFQSDLTAPACYVTKIVGNAVVNYGGGTGTNSLVCDFAKSSLCFGNRLLTAVPADASGSNPLRFATFRNIGNFRTKNTFVSGLDALDGNGDFNLGYTNTSYAKIFTGFPFSATTIEDAVTECKTYIPYASGGAFGAESGYINYINRTIDLTLEPSQFVWTPKLLESQSTVVTADDWRKNWAEYSRPITITNGEYQIADDDTGTNATAWTSAAGTLATNKFVRTRVTTPAIAATPITATVDVGGFESEFTAVTAPALSFTAADNQNTARSQANIGSHSFVKGVIAIRFRPDAYVANSQVLSSATASTTYLSQISTTAMRMQLGASARRFSIDGVLSVIGTTNTLIMSIDTTVANFSDAVKVNVNGSQVVINTSIWVTGAFTFGSNIVSLMAAGGGTNVFNGAIEFFWADWGDSSYVIPDINDPVFFSKFYQDNIGENGEGPMGYIPDLYYSGNLAQWNAGFANKGSLTAPLTTTGTYA